MKNFLLTLFFLISYALSSQVPTLGLIGGWPFTGNANDMSGSGNNGTVYNATLTTDRFGNVNSAYSFNGTTSYIQMLSAGPTGTVSRSVSFWAKTTNTLIQVGFNYGDAGNSGIYQILFNYNCQGVGVDNSNSALIRGNNTLANNQWHHLVAVYNSTVGSTIGSVDLYVDAVLQPSITCFVTSTNSPIASNNIYPIAIGRSSNSSARFFKGDLDDFYFYDRPLTYTEVQNLYNFSPCSSGPAAPGAISGNTNICLGTTNIYSVAPVTGATSYSWNLPGGWSGSSGSNTISTMSNISGGVVSVAAQNPCGMSAFNTLNINALGSPTMTVTGNLNICTGNNTSLMASGANTYTWNTGATSAGIVISPTITTTYTVTGTNSANCSSSVIKTVNVSSNIAPVISVAGPGQSCQGQTINLAANGSNTYTWEPGSLNGFYVSVTPTVTTTYTVTGTAANGCTNSAQYTQSVTICDGFNNNSGSTENISAFPNPSVGNIIISGLSHYKRLEVYNNLGQIMMTKEISNDNEELQLFDLAKGIYFLKIIGQETVLTKKIIKE